jgi:hypothetical protein
MLENSEHRGVDGEWSMVETLRHLVFVHDSWFRRCVLGLTEPFTALGLGPPFVMDQEENGLDPSAQPSLDEVLAVRTGRLRRSRRGWPRSRLISSRRPRRCPTTTDGPRTPRRRAVRQCLGTVLDEEWAHHRFCKRDLDKLSRQDPSQAWPTPVLRLGKLIRIPTGPLPDLLQLRNTGG